MTLTDKPRTQPTPDQVPTTRPALPSPQMVGGGVFVLIGVLWLLERTGTIDISVTVVLALGTMIIGISLMLLANDGPHGGLIVFGTILGAVTLLTAVAPFEGFQGGVGDRNVVVASVEAIQRDYNVALGKLTLDLRQIDDLETATPLSARVGMGELVIQLPKGVDVDIDARVGAGQVEIFGRVIDGLGIDESYTSPGLEPDGASFELQLEIFAGRVEVSDD